MATRTLSRWIDRLLGGSRVIECPHMEILGRDNEPPVFSGPGHISISVDARMQFVMHATPRDGPDAMKRINQARQRPYDIEHQFRVNAIGYDNTEWSGGYTSLTRGEITGNVWRLSGSIDILYTGVEGFGVAEGSSVELVYDRPLRLPIPMNMVRTVVRDGEQIFQSLSAGSKTIRILDAEIEFFRDAEHEHVWAVAQTTPNFPHPHLENWLSEPLNLLLGEVVAPRLMARNFGNGHAAITLHQLPVRSKNPLLASILRNDPLLAGDRFWSLYKDILTLVAMARDGDGKKNFEAHPLTRFYREIIQATNDSNWVLCMTLASTVEGLIKLMYPGKLPKVTWPEEDMRTLTQLINGWNGNEQLREKLLGHLQRLNKPARLGPPGLLRQLASEKRISELQVKAWESLRNSVMHGELVIPWSDQEQDAQINHLIELTHRVAQLYMERELQAIT